MDTGTTNIESTTATFIPPAIQSPSAQLPHGNFQREIEEYLSDCALRDHSPTTIRLRLHDLTSLARFLHGQIPNFSSLTPGLVTALLASAKKRGCSAHSIDRLRRNIKTFHGAYTRRHNLPPLDFELVPKSRLPKLAPKAIDLADIRRAIAECDRDLGMFIQFQTDSALRLTEALSLKVRDVKLDTGLVLVERGKGNKARSLMIANKTLTALQEHIKSLPDGAEYLFISRRTNRPFTRRGMQSRLRRLSLKTGIALSCHRLRFSCAKMMLLSGADIHTLQARLGHSSPQMSLHYASLFSTEALERGKRFSPGEAL